MPYPKQNYFQKRTKPKGPKINERIRCPEVQVIDSGGQNLGSLRTKEAIEIKAEVLWTQEGITHAEAAHLGRSAGLVVVMDECPKKILEN